MRKSLATLIVSLLLCGGATAAVIAADQTPSKPVKVAMVTPSAMRIDTQAPAANSGGGSGFQGPGRGRGPMRTPAQRAAIMAQMCQNRYARTAGMLAYQEAQLNLNPQQSTAFNRWRTVQLDIAKRELTDCNARPDPRAATGQNGGNAQNRPTPPTPVERMAREQSMLQQRLADIQAERPALEALYSSLTPEQRDRFGMRGPGMGGRPGPGRFMGNRMQRGPMGRNMRGPGRPPQGGPNGPGRQGPPPPPQP